jgi:hypothetical protein
LKAIFPINSQSHAIATDKGPAYDMRQSHPLAFEHRNHYTFNPIVPAPALANIRDTVAGWTLKSLAASAAVLVPVDTIETISSCWTGLSLGRRPPMQPRLRAASNPALVRSRRIALSNSAKALTICINMRPGAVVVSIASVKLLNAFHDHQHVPERTWKSVKARDYEYIALS